MLNLCSAAIDWSATGSMISALGTWAGVGAVVFATQKGFSVWKRQKITERKMDLAEQLLDHAYRLQAGFFSMRVPFKHPLEVAKAKDSLANRGLLGPEDPEEQRLLLDSELYLNRYDMVKKDIDGFTALLPRVKALFGDDVEKPAYKMLVVFSRYQMAAQGLSSALAFGSGFEDHQLTILHLNPNERGVDGMQQQMIADVKALTDVLVPILRESV